jgi:glucokinase
MIVLAGDIGGTKVDLGLFETAGPAAPPAMREQARFASRQFHDLEHVCAEFLKDRAVRPDAAAFGIAGPIVGGRCETTNFPWVIERVSLEQLLKCPVAMLNDLESMAHGIPHLAADRIHTLNDGRESRGAARAIIAAGSGLGEGYMVWDGSCDRHIPCASEGGHSDFAARNAEEIEMLGHFIGRYGHVSVERVVSGMGILEIFGYLADTGRYDVPASLHEAIAAGDAAAGISKAAMHERTPICVETMRLFVAAYGAEAGNLALKVMALGGLYVGGGIAPRIMPLLGDGLFMSSFLDKGRFAPLMARIPVRIILDERAALIGAAAVAARMLDSGTRH